MEYYLDVGFEYRSSVNELFDKMHYIQSTPRESGTFYYIVSSKEKMFLYISYLDFHEDEWAASWTRYASVVIINGDQEIVNALEKRNIPKKGNFLVLRIKEYIQGTPVINMINLALTFSGDPQLRDDLRAWHFREGNIVPRYTKQELEYRFFMKATQCIERVGLMEFGELLNAPIQDHRKMYNAISQLQKHYNIHCRPESFDYLEYFRQLVKESENANIQGSDQKNGRCDTKWKRRRKENSPSVSFMYSCMFIDAS